MSVIGDICITLTIGGCETLSISLF